MPAAKRSTSTTDALRSPTRLVEAASPFSSSVTLVTLKKDEETEMILTRPTKRTRLDVSDEEELEEPRPANEPRSKRAKARPLRNIKPIPQSLGTPHLAPERWRETYDLIKEMRAKMTAPVDTMGCDQAQHKETDPKSQRLSSLISLMLSSQTKDEVTDAAVKQLRVALGGSITLDAIISAEDSTISEAIAKVGFWRRKTGYIKKAAERLRDNFNGDVPKTVDELCSLPGVGPKMAFLALNIAWNLNHGIGVDVHVHRITNRLGWHQPPTKTPEQTRLNLQSWLPHELHQDINHMLVGFGQMLCKPVGPLCDECTVNAAGLCPSAETPKVRKTKTKKVTAGKAGPAVEITLEASEETASSQS